MIPLGTKEGVTVWVAYEQEEKVCRGELWCGVEDEDWSKSVTVKLPRAETLGQFPFHTMHNSLAFLTELEATEKLVEILRSKRARASAEYDRLIAAVGHAVARAANLKAGAPERGPAGVPS